MDKIEELATHDVTGILAGIKSRDAWGRQDRQSTLLFEDERLRISLIAMHASTAIARHKVDCPISVQVIEGKLKFNTDKESAVLQRGQILTLKAGVWHDLEAIEETAFLLTKTVGWLP